MIKKIFVIMFCALLVFSVSPKIGFAETSTEANQSGTVTTTDTTGTTNTTGTADTSTGSTSTGTSTNTSTDTSTNTTDTSSNTTADTTNTTTSTTTGSTVGTDPTNTSGNSTTPVSEEVKNEAGITPDSFLYSLEQMIESVQLALTFNQEGKAELLIEFANERLAEAQVINEKNQSQLVDRVLHAYISTVEKANTICKTAVEQEQTSDNVGAILDKIEVLQNDGEKVAIKITGSMPQEQSQAIIDSIKAQVKITLASKAYVTVKKEFVNSVHNVAEAKKQLEAAIQSGDQAAIAAAQAKLQETEQYRDQMAQLKKDVQELRRDVKKEQLEILKEQRKAMGEDKKEIANAKDKDEDEDHESGNINKKITEENSKTKEIDATDDRSEEHSKDIRSSKTNDKQQLNKRPAWSDRNKED
ncbi:MAG: hypothetical protein GX434_11070 [Peptococcaceae bacterium]|nr:hypothetical protein [Peptococcaceae bacterium]